MLKEAWNDLKPIDMINKFLEHIRTSKDLKLNSNLELTKQYVYLIRHIDKNYNLLRDCEHTFRGWNFKNMTHQESGQMKSIQDTLLKLATEWVKIEITNNGGGT